jgi:membrane-bound lytic murein transglycosylase C
MKRRIVAIMALALMILGVAMTSAPAREDPPADPFERMQRTQRQFEQRFQNRMREQHDELQERVIRQDAQLKRRVTAMWGKFVESNQTMWATYSQDGNALAKTDFENGEIEIEVIIPEDISEQGSQGRQEYARVKAREQLKQIIQEEAGDDSVLFDQLAGDSQGVQTITVSNVGEMFDLHYAPKVTRTGTVRGEDNKRRDHYRLRIRMVPDHLQRRLKRYLPHVFAHARTWNIKPSYLLAFMHTESSFNPVAKSNFRFGGKTLHAYGLMQVVPEFAGREINRRVLGQDEPPSADTLKDPERNIWYGAAYINYMRDKRFLRRAGGDQDKSMWLSIVAYNTGAGFVIRNVLSKVNQRSTREDFYQQVLRASSPNDYLGKVAGRQQKYIEYDQGM